jgi:2-polyprenyl-3-methyl-5-hydroxy-6-metoxy-1,4-benzoquinol methylase
MLTQLWRKKFGDGVIDTDVNDFNQTLALGDISGQSFICDYYGNVLMEVSNPQPVWGIAHAYFENGAILLVSGHADKRADAGAIVAHIDDQEVFRYPADQPIWDVYIDFPRRHLLATGWGGSFFVFDINTWTLLKRYELGRPLYGICPYKEGSVLLSVDRTGLAVYRPKTEPQMLWKLKSACYNVSSSPEHGFVVTGTHGPYLVCLDSDGEILDKADEGEVLAVHATGNLVIVGGKSGTLTFRSVKYLQERLYQQNLGSAVWNISEDKRNEHLFLALGDGSVICYHLALHPERIEALEAFVASLKSGEKINFKSWLENGVPASVLIPRLLVYMAGNEFTAEECEDLRSFLRRVDERSESETFLKAILDYHSGDLKAAVEGLQVVTTTHPNYSLAVLLMTRSLVALGDEAGARQYLLANYSNIESRFLPEAFQLLTELSQGVSPSILSGLREGAAPRRPTAAPLLSLDLLEETADTRKRRSAEVLATDEIAYSFVDYIKYEVPNRAGQAKKSLEHFVVENHLRRDRFVADDCKPRSLDIGCATCRYPNWFAEQGFHAVGYDVDDSAIKICQRLAKKNECIEIHKRDILESPPESDQYSVVTCMMGTFNHIERHRQAKFAEWIYESLKGGGLFIVSSWNIDCPYTSHLYFYNREQHERIRANCRTLKETESLLKECGFLVRSIPVCYLPDECYEAWMGELSDPEVIDVDLYLAERLGSRNAQMFVVFAEKP